MKTQVIAESAQQLAVYDSQMDDCDDEMTLRTGEMEEATSANNAAQASFNACTSAADVAD
jgi:hypothetical protein